MTHSYKTMLSKLFALGIIFNASAQDASLSDSPEKQQKIIKVCSLNSIEANQEFQRNVQLLRLQRQNIIELKAKLDDARKRREKKKIQKELDQMLDKLNDNNKKMFDTYGFSLTRNYTQVVETSHIYMLVTAEESEKFEQFQTQSDKASKAE
jgi:hypothetical protein